MQFPNSNAEKGLPPRFLAAIGVAAAFSVFVAVDQAHWWQLRPDYAFGWLVPFLVVFVVRERWPRLRGLFGEIRSGSSLPIWLRTLKQALAGCVLLAGLSIFILGAIYRAGAGATQPGSLALAIGIAGAVLGLVYFNVPEGSVGAENTTGVRSLANDARIRVVAMFLFPALVWMLSAPLVTAVENFVSLFLLRKVVGVVFAVFNILGYPLIQQGNVLILPHGQVGVADACSGIRSLTACLFSGAFLASVFLDGILSKILLVGAAMILAFITNLMRSLFLTAWAYANGSDSIEGRLHDATGFAVLGLTTVCLFCILPLFKRSNWERWLGISGPGGDGSE